ncbi:hypothetical protein PF007_g32245 [Phytophthora fragariae]|uniref:Uncharacterized protein n=2 Tax=Phytophthora fragariae TaxID=53985 RepID=A0A6A3D6K5_9STRA|nr:hypothetical protein PF009_g32647 [Phytophthora fragariae]KAE8954322.1 hypothetical protein PF011_g32135 [Phytophthora fragariae]KAE9055656.1 hypothetical protein PF007_g32245 [Phytophthora fragariae]
METELKEMNFAHDAFQFQWDEIIMPALRHFYKVHGHTDVSYRFVVPDSDDAWPRLSWNWPLGGTVLRVRIGNGFSRQVGESKEELKKMKLCYEMTIFERDWNEKILPALMELAKCTTIVLWGSRSWYHAHIRGPKKHGIFVSVES